LPFQFKFMYDICCVGHITSDKVVTTKTVIYMAGGTAFYFSNAVSKLDLNYLLVTALAPAEMHYVTELREKGIEVKVQSSRHTVYFENIYAENQDQRTQNVLQKANPFTPGQFNDIEAKIFHLGPLLADDISTQLIKTLAVKGIVSLDVQGYLREVINKKVYAVDWPDKKKALQYVTILKADVAELQALTGCDDVKEGVKLLGDWGVKEVVITNGSQGSVIYSDGVFYNIPAYRPETVVDATGCGDTYMAGYLYKRIKGAGLQQAGEFAAAMAGFKTKKAGPFMGTEEDVMKFLEDYQ
jgi:sugar/nucleoside kinase (ribokinase family)